MLLTAEEKVNDNFVINLANIYTSCKMSNDIFHMRGNLLSLLINVLCNHIAHLISCKILINAVLYIILHLNKYQSIQIILNCL